MIHDLGVLVLAAAAYGYTIGAAHSPLYAQRDVVKLPLLILGTGLVCGVAYLVVGRFLVPTLTAGRVRDLVVGCFRDLSVLLASLAPPNLFVALVLVNTDDSALGEYSLFLGLNVLFVAACGALALARRGRELLRSLGLGAGRTAAVLTAWVLLTLCVGGQGAFYLRPFFGLPASRGNVPPFALGTEPDVRGATNFFEAVAQVVREPPLPAAWTGADGAD